MDPQSRCRTMSLWDKTYPFKELEDLKTALLVPFELKIKLKFDLANLPAGLFDIDFSTLSASLSTSSKTDVYEKQIISATNISFRALSRNIYAAAGVMLK